MCTLPSVISQRRCPSYDCSESYAKNISVINLNLSYQCSSLLAKVWVSVDYGERCRYLSYSLIRNSLNTSLRLVRQTGNLNHLTRRLYTYLLGGFRFYLKPCNKQVYYGTSITMMVNISRRLDNSGKYIA